jgi:hypothetical protein
VELSELTALRVDKQGQGFVLTLIYGEIKTQIDQPLYAGEEFMVKVGDLALSVRGTVFTVNYSDKVVKVAVESGEVAVLDERGKEIEVLGAGESGEYEAEAGGSRVEATPAQTPTPAPTPTPDIYVVGNIVEFGGYEWRVLEVGDGKALLLSEYILELRPYHGESFGGWFEYYFDNLARLFNMISNNEYGRLYIEGYVDVDVDYSFFDEASTTWADCDLRAYLNGEFYHSFSESDRARIADALNINKDNPWFFAEAMASEHPFQLRYPPMGGADTNDKIFLLSLEEAVKYFGDSGQLANRPTNANYIDDQYSEARMAYTATNFTYIDDFGETATVESGTVFDWWLRSPGHYSHSAAFIGRDNDNDNGILFVSGPFVKASRGIRPALWLNLV